MPKNDALNYYERKKLTDKHEALDTNTSSLFISLTLMIHIKI